MPVVWRLPQGLPRRQERLGLRAQQVLRPREELPVQRGLQGPWSRQGG